MTELTQQLSRISGRVRLQRLSAAELAREMPWLGNVVLAIIFGLLTFAMAERLGLPVRDPEGTFGARMIFPFMLLVLALVADAIIRVGYRAWHSGNHWREAWESVRRDRIRWDRYGLALIGFLSFNVIYLSYRNMKSFLPFLRDVNYDAWLADTDRWLTFGHDPALVLHDLLGTGVWAYILDSVYLLYLPLIPVSIAAALMFGKSLRQGFWYVTAISLNWILGIVSYYTFPSIGPIYYDARKFEVLPYTGVERLQDWLAYHRMDFFADPVGSGAMQSIAAFASLHVSVVASALFVLALLGYRRMAAATLVFLLLTMLATVYFGWHYILDDVAGLGIAAIAVWAAAWMTGIDRERLREQREARKDGPIWSLPSQVREPLDKLRERRASSGADAA